MSFQGPSGTDKRMQTTSSATGRPAGGGQTSSEDDGSSDGDRGSATGTGKKVCLVLEGWRART